MPMDRKFPPLITQVNSFLSVAIRLTYVFVPSVLLLTIDNSDGSYPRAPADCDLIFSSVSMFVLDAIVEHPATARIKTIELADKKAFFITNSM